MREFFGGWRRKTGCVLLLITCLFMAGWVRSLIVYDCAEFFYSDHQTHTLFSASHLFGYQDHYEKWPRTRPSLMATNWGSGTIPDISYLFSDNHITWSWQCFGFSKGEYLEARSKGCRLRFWIFPYWSIVGPLTLLSAYLLLWKQRVAKPKIDAAN